MESFHQVSELAQADIPILWEMPSDYLRCIFILSWYEKKWVLKFSKEYLGERGVSKISGESGCSDLESSKQFSAFVYDPQEHMKLISKYKVVFSNNIPKGIVN